MELGTDEANLIYEDRIRDTDAISHHGDSEEEDIQKEVEVMLYSHVYFDDSSIKENAETNISSCEPSITVKPVAAGSKQPKFNDRTSSRNVRISPTGRPQLPLGCSPSQFNHPNRIRASRYYDFPHDKSTFIAPQNPDQKHRSESRNEFCAPSDFTVKLMARSANEKSFMPNATRSKLATTKKIEKVTSEESTPAGSSLVGENQVNTITCEEHVSRRSAATEKAPNANIIVEKSRSINASSKHAVSAERTFEEKISEVLTAMCDRKTASEASEPPTQNVNKVVSRNQVLTAVCEELDSNSENMSEKDKSVNTQSNERSKISTASSKPTSSAKKCFEDKVSKVLSSMLDDESRSSLDDNHPTSCADQIPKGLNSDSDWCIGMSWADMSSKSFEVDIEEESVSSLQLQDNSFTADSGTNTPDPDGQIEANKDKNDDPPEPSRYDIQLKDKCMENKDTLETDSESEAGSIVEVAPPVKPAPVIVDLSDGEEPLNGAHEKIVKPKPSPQKDIVILPGTKRNIVELTIDSSSDDDPVVVDVSEPPSKSNKTISSKTSTKRSSDGPLGPRKRISVHEDYDGVLEQPIIADLPKKNSIEELDKWLHNPIKSCRSLDHSRLLSKMSDDPKLWKLCQADISGVRYSPTGPKCVNCNLFGHKTKFCPAPPKVVNCHMCGAPGHSETRCTQKMCLRCGKKNNVYVDRCKECARGYANSCKICRSHSHEGKQCPDLWRRYHMTVSDGEITHPEGEDAIPKNKHYCSNCAGKGHLSHECKQSQWKCEAISPFIVSYQSPSSEDRKLSGTDKFAMLLTNDTAGLLLSAEGHNFLQCVSEATNVSIHTSFDIDVKKIVFEGTSVDALDARSRILDWIKEQKKKGPARKKFMDMFVPKSAVDHWSSPDGKSYVQEVSRECGIVIHTLFGGRHKKFLLEGLQQDVQKARVLMRQWVAAQKRAKPIAGQGKYQVEKSSSAQEASPTSRAQTEDICPLPPPLPRKTFLKLADALEEELKLMDCPKLTNFTVRQLYDRMCSNQANTFESIKARKCCARLLCMILLGKCGFAGGYQSVKALKALVTRLREMKANTFDRLYNQVMVHYQKIFSGDFRDDFEKLVQKFYANEALVKKIEGKTVPTDPCTAEVNPAPSAQSESSKLTIEGPSTAAQNKSSGTLCIDSFQTISETSEEDVWPQKVVERSYSPTGYGSTAQNVSKNSKWENRLKQKTKSKKQREKTLVKEVTTVINNLSSRFLVSQDQQSLVKMLKTYKDIKEKKLPCNTKLLAQMSTMKNKLCKSHNITV